MNHSLVSISVVLTLDLTKVGEFVVPRNIFFIKVNYIISENTCRYDTTLLTSMYTKNNMKSIRPFNNLCLYFFSFRVVDMSIPI